MVERQDFLLKSKIAHTHRYIYIYIYIYMYVCMCTDLWILCDRNIYIGKINSGNGLDLS